MTMFERLLLQALYLILLRLTDGSRTGAEYKALDDLGRYINK